MQDKSIIDVTQRPGFIYVMSVPSFQNVLKIGKTTRLPGYRAAELSSSTSVPQPFVLEWHRFLGKDLDTIEARIHQELAANRINNDREFFQMTVSQAISKINEIVDGNLSHRFAGTTYRHSQLAKWGCFFGYIQVPFKHLTQPVTLAGSISFQPDFWLPQQGCFMVISRDLFSSKTGQLAGLYFAQKTGKVLLSFWDCKPGVEPTSDDDIILHTGQYVTPEGDFDGCIEWGVCPNCGSRHVGHLGHAELCDLSSRNTSPKNCQCYNILNPHEDLMRAYEMVAYIFDGEPL
jgi:hypothetical protein